MTSKDALRLAAGLGHPRARELEPDVDRVAWSDEDDRRWVLEEASQLLGPTLPARLAADCAEHVQPEGDTYVQEALAATRAWIANPCDALRDAAAAIPPPPLTQDRWQDYARTAASYALSCTGQTPEYYASQATACAALATRDEAQEHTWQQGRLAAYLMGKASRDEPR